jgi:integrase
VGIYARHDSKYWWMLLEGTSRKVSTKIPIGHGASRRDSRQQADEVYRAAMGDVARKRFHLPQDKPVMTFATWAKWYQEHVTDHQRGHVRAKSMIKQLVRFFGDSSLAHIDSERIEGWKTDRAKEVKPQTVNRELEILRPLFRMAVPKYLDASPCKDVKMFRKLTSAPVTIVAESAEDALLEHATAEERALVLLGIDALLRLGDARRLRLEHDHGTHLDVVDPKVQRYQVPVSQRLRLALDELKSAADKAEGFYFGRRRKGVWKAMNQNTAHLLFADLCTRANVPRGRAIGGITFHSTRHTGATRAARKVKLRVVQQLGGWKSLKQLERYDHPDDPELIRAVEAIGAASAHKREVG